LASASAAGEGEKTRAHRPWEASMVTSAERTPRGVRAGRGARLEVAEGEEKVPDATIPAVR